MDKINILNLECNGFKMKLEAIQSLKLNYAYTLIIIICQPFTFSLLNPQIKEVCSAFNKIIL